MVYRDLDDISELTKVAAALEVAEKGRMYCYKGKKFSDLQLDPVSQVKIKADIMVALCFYLQL